MPLLYAYGALALSAFTSATVLPGTSEAAFAAFVYRFPAHALAACLLAGGFNALGSMVSYGMGRLLPERKRPSEQTQAYFERYGTWLLLLSWVPVAGDALPLAAGWLRLHPLKCALMLLAGKLLRYAAILLAMRGLM